MNILMLPMDDIKPYQNNPRKNKNAVKYVANSIKEFGFRQPIVIDKNNVIVAGHTRYEAAKQLKFKEVPCVMTDDLTDEQIKAYRLVDNKTAEFAEWDLSMLNAELEGIFDLNMEEFGFTELISEEAELEKVELLPYKKVHCLLSYDLNLNDKVLQILESLKGIEGIEIESTLN